MRYELLLLAELGFGLDLDSCAVTGANDGLVAVSPQIRPGRQRRRGRALCRQAACRLPAFVREGAAPIGTEIAQGLDLTGHFLDRAIVLADRSRSPTRAHRLVERLAARRIQVVLARARLA